MLLFVFLLEAADFLPLFWASSLASSRGLGSPAGAQELGLAPINQVLSSEYSFLPLHLQPFHPSQSQTTKHRGLTTAPAQSHTAIKNMFIFNDPRFCEIHWETQNWVEYSISAVPPQPQAGCRTPRWSLSAPSPWKPVCHWDGAPGSPLEHKRYFPLKTTTGALPHPKLLPSFPFCLCQDTGNGVTTCLNESSLCLLVGGTHEEG